MAKDYRLKHPAWRERVGFDNVMNEAEIARSMTKDEAERRREREKAREKRRMVGGTGG